MGEVSMFSGMTQCQMILLVSDITQWVTETSSTPLQYNQGCIKYFIFWGHNANKNIFCMQTLGILCLNLITKQNSV